MDWPAYSPDLNPIEYVWDMLGRRIAARQPPPTCLPELRRALLDEWCNIPQDQIDNLILSMPRRCKKYLSNDDILNNSHTLISNISFNTDPCNSNPCLNKGKCKVEGKIFKCECRPPYTGPTCKDDLCTKNPCQNGGTCNISGTSFECKCKIPYTGKLCEKGNFTEEINMTTYEPSNFTYDFNGTTSEPSNFTQDFNWTTSEPSNFTGDFNRTTFEPSNFTNEFNWTTYEPSNFTYDVNMTSYEPYNITNENSSETTSFVFTTSIPTSTMTTKKPGVCDNNPCQNGGTCREDKGIAKCVCPPQYRGENCSDSIWCKEGEGKELCQGGGCTFDFQTKLGRCTCPDDKYYNYERKQCEDVDRCLLKSIKCNEKNNEVCKNGECQCKEDFIRNNASKCMPNFCALNPCGENEVCEDIEKDPGYVKCKCKEGYNFNGEYCLEGNVCSIPSKLNCQQICDIDTRSCDCYSGFILQSDKKTCGKVSEVVIKYKSNY
ncbi:hypothetical protein AVEN_70753-1 [Araneus ventricosus]|uniref:EGF-like domain-containing protein n=1 Tax=Araneus ventricosus TaxID=182803 RepID=A0A4Y2N1H3_ARAVE|nr:hypothetical protein AVEN_70753-1 [Araneus ventricosus]